VRWFLRFVAAIKDTPLKQCSKGEKMGFLKMRRQLALGFSGLLVFPAMSRAVVSDEWQKFQADPKAYVTGHASRVDEHGRPVPDRLDSAFSNHDIRTRRYLEKKADARKALRRELPYQPYLFEEEVSLKRKVAGFLDLKEFEAKGIRPLFRLEEFDAQGLQKAELPQAPWSGSYWPIYQGILASRYASRPFIDLRPDWKAYYDFTRASTLATVLASGSEVDLDSLSPAEKYDLLIGQPDAANPEGFLTPAMWEEGKMYYDRYGKVEPWMGICHGWAPAAFMVPRPRHSVVARGVPERAGQVKFYPVDTKGLISLLWAKGASEMHFFGGRCNNKAPSTDPETGRVTDPECFDINPGFWHVSLMNQLGLAKRSMIIDVSFDYEVWNQPLKAYRYRYFHPQTGEMSDTVQAAIVKKADFSKDKFRKFRSERAAAYVGVQMDLTYVSETWNFQSESDDESGDAYRTLSYLYDLELDAEGNIIGGEWYRNEHPDFAWLPLAGTRAVSSGDSQAPSAEWDPSRDQVPAFWRDIAIATARVNGEPLAVIVEPLAAAAARGRR